MGQAQSGQNAFPGQGQQGEKKDQARCPADVALSTSASAFREQTSDVIQHLFCLNICNHCAWDERAHFSLCTTTEVAGLSALSYRRRRRNGSRRRLHRGWGRSSAGLHRQGSLGLLLACTSSVVPAPLHERQGTLSAVDKSMMAQKESSRWTDLIYNTCCPAGVQPGRKTAGHHAQREVQAAPAEAGAREGLAAHGGGVRVQPGAAQAAGGAQ